MKAAGRVQTKKRLPVFVSPEELQFIGEDESTHKQILTIFNPYSFNIRFKVMSNAPHKYTVVESQGVLNARCCIDLVVCHRLASDGPYDVSDKFKVELFRDYRGGSSRSIGCRLISSVLTRARSNQQNCDESVFAGMNDSAAAGSPFSSTMASQLPHSGRRARSSSSVLLVLAAIACLLVLLLPLDGEQPDWPSYLHITVNQKLIAAFALGLLTLAILKS